MNQTTKEITLYYDPATEVGKKALAYALSLGVPVNDVEYHKTPLTTTHWKQIVTLLGMEPKQLLNKAHPYYQKAIRGRAYDDEGWLHILMWNPELIAGPIAIRGTKAVLCSNPMDIYRLDAVSA